MTKIAVVTALNTHNAGMLSVDLAAEDFLQTLGPVSLEYFRTHDNPTQPKGSFAGQRFKVLSEPSMLEPYEVVLYWGDFLNNPAYGLEDFHLADRRMGLASDQSVSFERWKVLCLLKGYRRPRGQKILSVSNNFQAMEDAFGRLDDQGRKEVSQLLQANFDGIFPRDEYSRLQLSRTVPLAANGNVRSGVDAAFLLEDERLVPFSGRDPKRRLSYFFGRSGYRNKKILLGGAALTRLIYPMRLSDWFGIVAHIDGRRQMSQLLTTLCDSRCVLTDTYHLCVTALRLGVPVVGVGRPSMGQSGSTGDFKKKVLFESWGAADRYLELDSVGWREAVLVTRAVQNAIAQNQRTGDIQRAIWKDVEAYKTLLRDAIQSQRH